MKGSEYLLKQLYVQIPAERDESPTVLEMAHCATHAFDMKIETEHQISFFCMGFLEWLVFMN